MQTCHTLQQRVPHANPPTSATIPTIHDAHPTAILDRINIDFVGWDGLPGWKSIDILFESDAQDVNQLDDKILTAVAGSLAPRPGDQCLLP